MTKKFRPKELDVASRSNLFRNFMQHHHRSLGDIYYSSGYTQVFPRFLDSLPVQRQISVDVLILHHVSVMFLLLQGTTYKGELMGVISLCAFGQHSNQIHLYLKENIPPSEMFCYLGGGLIESCNSINSFALRELSCHQGNTLRSGSLLLNPLVFSRCKNLH